MIFFAVRHIFNQHLLSPVHHQGIEIIHNQQTVWTSVYLLTGLLILTNVKKYSYQNLISNEQFDISFRHQRKFERIEANAAEIFPHLLNLFFILNLAYLIFAVNQTYDIVFHDLGFLWQIAVFIGLSLFVVGVKAFLNSTLIFITSKGKLIKEYQRISGSMNRLSGLLLFPLLLLLGFSEINSQIIIFLSLSLVTVMLVLKWLKGFLLCLEEEGLGILQILTYFCALEILPQLVLVRYTIETFKAG